MKKIAIAMSGGVDSGVAAALLIRKGYQCEGFYLKLWRECPSFESLEFVQKTAQKLGIPLHLVDLTKLFKKKVVDEFLKDYASGLTPNPCVFCNKFIKFGELLAYVQKLGFDYLATGHYARIAISSPNENFISVSDSLANKHLLLNNLIGARKMKLSKNLSGSPYYSLLAGKDKSKDQSYFLYNLTQSQLAHILFPIGDYQKKEVVVMAKKWKLPVASRPESQEICFLPENDYRPFLKRHLQNKIKSGKVVDIKGRIIGSHQGLPLYTIGQRHGFNLNRQIKTPVLPPYYVIDKNVEKNQLIVGFGKETERKEFFVEDVNWLALRSLGEGGIKCFVRIRHQGSLLEAKLKKQKMKLKVILHEPERGIAPGQAAVFYLGEEVLGGGIIAN